MVAFRTIAVHLDFKNMLKNSKQIFLVRYLRMLNLFFIKILVMHIGGILKI